MKICNDMHEEIVIDGISCPLCEAISEVNRLKEELELLKEKNEDLILQLEEAKEELAIMESKINGK